MEILTQRHRGTENGRAGSMSSPHTPHAPWPRVKLGEVCELLTDGDWIESKDQSNSGIRIVQTGNIGLGVYKDNASRARFISETTFNRLNCTEIFPGDILISRLPDPVGRACLIPATPQRMITAVDCSIIRLRSLINPKFFVIYTQSPQYFFDIGRFIKGATRPRISRANLASVEIPLPPLPVQRTIVAKLERELAAVDVMEKKYEEMEKTAETGFKAGLQEAFDEVSRGGAETRRLGEVCEFLRNGASIKQIKGAGGLPITRIETLSGGVFNPQRVGFANVMSADRYTNHIVGIGDILISHINSAAFVGRAVMYRGEIPGLLIHGMNLLRGRIKDDQVILPSYVEYYFKTSNAHRFFELKMKKSVNQVSISASDFKQMEIPCPPRNTQCAIVARLDAARVRKEKLVEAAQKGAETAALLRKALLKEAFE